MIAKGSRVRFKQDKFDLKRRERDAARRAERPPQGPDASDPPLVPGPDETFVVRGIIPWVDRAGKEHVEQGWADLGPSHPLVALAILEQV